MTRQYPTEFIQKVYPSFYWEEAGGVFSSLPSTISGFEVATELNVRARSCGLDLGKSANPD